ncbi:MAG: hypothetical protein E7005_02590 [Alphaproteobacteria bacterium]|nr:hypothetical protein [Alphaproteobacteria bacterium]
MKLKKLVEELDFLSSSSVDEVREYIKLYSFKQDAELVFVEKFPLLVSLYLERYSVFQKTARIIIQSNNLEHINLLVKSEPKKYNPHSLLFDIGEYATIIEWLKDNDSPKYPEKELFWNGKIEDIISFIEKRKVSRFGQYDLIRSRNHRAVNKLIKCCKLDDKNKLSVMLYGSKENASLMVTYANKHNDYLLFRQIFDIRFKKASVVEKMTRTRLLKPAEDLFFEISDIDLVVKYAKHFGIVNFDIRILKRSNRDGMIKFLSKNAISSEAEILLFNRGDHAEIKTYLKSHELDDSSEVRLIKRGHHREIMLYLKHHSLCLEAQRELLLRGNSVEIIEFVSNYPVADEIYYKLIKRNYCDEIDALNEFMMKQPCLY